MNNIEKEMLEILKELKNNGAIAVKAEFEAEGTRTEELLRLLDIARKANMGIALKVGGCEAVKDLTEAKQIGVDYIIAPMVETPYALEKFIQAKNKVFLEEEREDINFLINVETETSFINIDNIISLAKNNNGIDGLVFGRVDYVGSKKYHPDKVDERFVLNDCIEVSKKSKKNNLDFVVGGGISDRAIPNLKKLNEIHLSRFETRKIIFTNSAINSNNIKKSLLNAVHFELLWLLNKRKFYSMIMEEDDKRLNMLNNRWKLLSSGQLKK